MVIRMVVINSLPLRARFFEAVLNLIHEKEYEKSK